MNTWAAWVPGHCLASNRTSHLRVPWVAALSFGYCCILSATRATQPQTQTAIASSNIPFDRRLMGSISSGRRRAGGDWEVICEGWRHLLHQYREYREKGSRRKILEEGRRCG